MCLCVYGSVLGRIASFMIWLGDWERENVHACVPAWTGFKLCQLPQLGGYRFGHFSHQSIIIKVILYHLTYVS